jgi:hypothetical protein
MTLPEVKDVIRWTWLGPLLIAVVMAMASAWAVNVDRKVGRLEEAVTELIRTRGELNGKLDTIVNQNSSQDIRMTQISNRLDSLLNIHMNGKFK